MSETNIEIADRHTRRIIGPTIAMGDGSYFDYENPEASTMTIDDYAYGLAYTCRFRGQTRRPDTGARAFYGVAEHCVRLARHLIADGYADAAYDGLMHEGGEPVVGDMPGPMKPMFPAFKLLEKRCEAASFVLFNVPMRDPSLIKRYDLRMLATEKRDLMPATAGETWAWAQGYEPFNERIIPWTPDEAADAFRAMYHRLRP